jgi:hypothetical protein
MPNRRIEGKQAFEMGIEGLRNLGIKELKSEEHHRFKNS